MAEKFKDACGVFGIYGHPEAAKITYLGLHALQHRGQESSGIVTSDQERLYVEIGMGLVADVFSGEVLRRLPGDMAIGHNRYSTTGASHIKNAQPFVAEYMRGGLAIAHNGNLVNATSLRAELEENGSIFRSTNDTEVIAHLIAVSHRKPFLDRVVEALTRVRGAYSLLLMTEKELIAARDPYGFRPLCLGALGEAHVVASETCALDLIEASHVRDVEPGEILIINGEGVTSMKPFKPVFPHQCIFEFVYFARPDSTIFGENVYLVRQALGRQLAREAPVDADIVVPVPDSGVPAAMGFSKQSGIPFELGLIRNHYVGRTFIEPQQSIRHFGVKIKLNTVRRLVEGKRVIVIDDSIVRGTTSRKIVSMIRGAGAREVHMRISSPPTTHPCYYGIDTPTRRELIAASRSCEEIRRYLEVDSLQYLSLDGLISAVEEATHGRYCSACFTGRYPVTFPEMEVPQELELPFR
ncbi:MAG: amidophosphoribosyltransferase [Candidatus Tectomicrobia bacterium]|uniref:Amidophosphoribosyltransferase n=1 Tax=Tectimicrobiota bacterium TaxID=2528274 RepID=A0A932GRB5_UNCTE|nr:amidophosphoribosyltransferase [Candidatus Tectomicrobia bacterium]